MEPAVHKLELPTRISWVRNKRGDLDWFSLNLNEYRNAHHRILHNAKIAFEDMAVKLVEHLPQMEKIDLVYTLYLGSARKADLANICTVVDKFFRDSLVKAERLTDDNIDHIRDIRFLFGGIDRDNPRIDVEIYVLSQKEEPVKITIEAHEVHDIVRAYIAEQITLREGQEFSFTPETDGSFSVLVSSTSRPAITASSNAVGIATSVTNSESKPTSNRGRPRKTVEPVVETKVEAPATVEDNEPPFDVDEPAEEDAISLDGTPTDSPDSAHYGTEEEEFVPPDFLTKGKTEPQVEEQPSKLFSPMTKPAFLGGGAPTGQTKPNSLFGNLKSPNN